MNQYSVQTINAFCAIRVDTIKDSSIMWDYLRIRLMNHET